MATTKRGMRDYTINTDGVTEQSIDAEGDYIHVQSVLPAGSEIFLRLDDGSSVGRYQGQGNRVYYSRVSVLGSAAGTIILQLGYGYATDTRTTVSAGSITAPVQPALHNVPLATVVCGAGAQTLIAAADINRSELAIQIDSGAPGGIFIGDNTVANENGFYAEPGDKVFWGSEAAVYVWNPNASSVKVRLCNLRNI